jgi:hypothetical protein
MAERRILAKVTKTKTKSGVLSSSVPIARKSGRKLVMSAARRISSPEPDQDSPPGSPPEVQADPSSDLSLPATQLMSGIAVISLNPALMSNPPVSAENPPASGENLPASAEITANSPASAETSVNLPALAVRPSIVQPPILYVGEKAPQLGENPTRGQVAKVASFLMSSNLFKPTDCVKEEYYGAPWDLAEREVRMGDDVLV